VDLSTKRCSFFFLRYLNEQILTVQTDCVYCAARTEYLYIIQDNLSHEGIVKHKIDEDEAQVICFFRLLIARASSYTKRTKCCLITVNQKKKKKEISEKFLTAEKSHRDCI
jgi:hypothetical protein